MLMLTSKSNAAAAMSSVAASSGTAGGTGSIITDIGVFYLCLIYLFPGMTDANHAIMQRAATVRLLKILASVTERMEKADVREVDRQLNENFGATTFCYFILILFSI